MATRASTIEFILDQLSSLGNVRAQKMFGEYALYFEEKVVALVCDDQFFLKITQGGKALVGARYEEGFPYPGAKPAILIGAEDLENDEKLCELVKTTAAELPPPKAKPLARRERGGISEKKKGATRAAQGTSTPKHANDGPSTATRQPKKAGKKAVERPSTATRQPKKAGKKAVERPSTATRQPKSTRKTR